MSVDITLPVTPQPVEHREAELLDVRDPATGETVGRIPLGGSAEAERLVAAAREAAPGWARTHPAERAAALRRLADRLEDAAGELAMLQTREMGKPLGDSRGGVAAGIGAIRQYAELGPLHRGRSLAGAWDATDLMVHEPHGVAAVIVPWNDPVAIACQMAAAALVTGNAVILKPSERAPLAAARVAELAGLPDGVFLCAHGDAAMGRALVAHPGVDLVVHIGSVAAGREIASVCAGRGAHAVLELGGKDALVVDADVDPEWAAAQAASGAFANSGQICTSVERIYVHRDIADRFLAALVREAGSRSVGDPRDPAVGVGPMVDGRQRDVVRAHVEDAVACGAEVLAGGTAPDGPGAFFPPTVVRVPDDRSLLMREETFGPVAAVRVVDDFAEGLRLADAGDYGLAATVLTASQANAQRAWRELQVGTVKINAVWGGAPGGAAHPRRASGAGAGYGPDLLDEVTRLKVVHVAPAPAPGRR